MCRPKLSVWLLVGLALLLSACAVPIAVPLAERGDSTTAEEASENDAEFQRILACVEENFPAESYFTNDLLPDPDAIWEPKECESVDQISVGMSWILNDGGAP